MIPNSAYHDVDVLREEIDRLFRSAYEFVCLTTEVANDGDFVAAEYFGTSLVVQNFKGNLRAFQNICTHRFNRLQVDDRGNRPLVCSYHGWRYNDEGCPLGVASRIALNSPRGADLCLPRYRVETCGQFVFVARSDTTVALRDYLGVFHDVLETISHGMGTVCHFGAVAHRANWKTLVENVIDNLHCPILHQDTFVAFGFCRKPVEDTVLDGPHSSWQVPRVEIAREGVRKRALAHLDARAYQHDSFYHIHIFPNLFIASTEGASFYIGHALPVGAEETQLRTRYLEPRAELTAAGRIKQDLLNSQTAASGLRIVEEDRLVLEAVQRGVRISDRPGTILQGEPRLANWMDQYRLRMGVDGEASQAS